MGSSGTGNLTDYPGSSKPANSSGGSGAEGGGGGASGQDLCNEAISASLEEVERCAYYQQQNTPPPNGTPITVRVQGRVAVETSNGELIGYLPTRFNYLAGCISDGRAYKGKVTSSSTAVGVSVQVDISPE